MCLGPPYLNLHTPLVYMIVNETVSLTINKEALLIALAQHG